MYMVNYLTTKEEQKAMLATFKELDTDGNGTLSREELLVGYTKLVGAEKAKEMVDNIMSQVDKNNSGSIDYSEFVGATMNR